MGSHPRTRVPDTQTRHGLCGTLARRQRVKGRLRHELGPLLDVATTKLAFEGTELRRAD